MIGAEESGALTNSRDLAPSLRMMREIVCVLMQSEEYY